jgi:DNA repair photolyase
MIVTLILKYKFSFVIQTKFTFNLERDLDLLGQNKDLVYFMPIVSPGLEKDWEVFENHKTSSPLGRVIFLRDRLKEKFNGGVNGEPFIPGYHTVQDFENTLNLLKEYKIKSYNTYHLHFNDLVAKNFNDLGLDIEKIHYMNQDSEWKKILIQLIDLAKKYDILLGCPDFINSGEYQESSNTCCGLDVPNPCTFNIINWKKGMNFEKSWDGIGDYEQGKKIFQGDQKEFYSLKDIEKPKSSGSSFLDEMGD